MDLDSAAGGKEHVLLNPVALTSVIAYRMETSQSETLKWFC